MLINVNVKNLALIKETDIYFGEGLNILTGETGAGKSIIIGSILIALGGKISKDMIRDEKKEALAELVFELNNKDTIEKLKLAGVSDIDNGELIISRKIVNGRSTTKVNGETFTAANLKNVTEFLIDIHGQHDHQSILKKDKQLAILDDYAGDNIISHKDNIKKEFQNYISLKNELKAFDIDDSAKEREMSFCQFEIDEINNAHLKKGEFEEVEEKYKKMSSAKDIIEKMNEIYELMGGSGYEGISDKISEAYRISETISEYDAEINSISSSLADIESICQDVTRAIKYYADTINFDEEETKNTEERLDEINRLRQKYEKKKISNDAVDNILAYRDEQQKKLDDLINFETKKNEIINKIADSEKALSKESLELSKLRKKYAKEFSNAVIDVLKGLNFLDINFEIEFKELSTFTSNGKDEITFLISTNPGENLKPLTNIASGGELSRIMLGIKTIMASKDEIETLIFDEIDTGISGKTAGMVANRMKEVSRNHQIICITHLPQIASKADNHYLIEKYADDNTTQTRINKLDYDESVNELARMLGGEEITKTAIDNAREMKELANN